MKIKNSKGEYLVAFEVGKEPVFINAPSFAARYTEPEAERKLEELKLLGYIDCIMEV